MEVCQRQEASSCGFNGIGDHHAAAVRRGVNGGLPETRSNNVPMRRPCLGARHVHRVGIWANRDHRTTGRGYLLTVSLQNLDVSQAIVEHDQGCARILIPCRQDAQCVLFWSENNEVQPAFRFELPVNTALANVDAILAAIKQLAGPPPGGK